MNNKKKKSDFSWGILIVLVPLLMRFLDGDMPPVAFGIVAVGLIFAFALSQVAKKKEKAAKQALEARLKAGSSAAGRKTPEVELHRPVPSMQRREPETRRDYSKPDAYCVSCDLSGEDHFVRDRNRRIAQLDEWLKTA